MRITYLHQYFRTPAMAGGTRSYEMARRFVQAGHSVNLVTSDQDGNGGGRWSWAKQDIDGITVHSLGVPYSNHMGHARRVASFAHFAAAASAKAAALPGDVVFATSTPLTIAIPGIASSRLRRIPMVFEVRDLWPAMPIAMGALRDPATIRLAHGLERMAYRNAAHIVALSQGMKAGVLQTGVPDECVTVVPNCCDSDLFDVPESIGRSFRAAHDFLGDRPMVLYAGTVGRINGVQYLVRLAAECLRRQAVAAFVVIGDGKDVAEVRALAREVGVLGQNFFMLPPMPKSEIVAALSASNVATSLFVDIPEMWVNSANKFFDGLAARRPLALNYGGWQADMIAETGAGLVMPPNDAAAASDQLLAFLADDAAQKRARQAARRLAEGPFDRNANAQRLISILEHVVETKGDKAMLRTRIRAGGIQSMVPH